MKRKGILFTLVVLFITTNITVVFAWGFWGHQRINRAAIFALPDSMRSFFYNHLDFITEEAQMPDVRIYALDYKDEVNRHFLDMEMLNTTSFDNVPRTMSQARATYPDSLLKKAGLLPWTIDTTMTKLTKAFQEKNKPYILFYAGDLAHYIGDATQPLHTTINYDGQLTGLKGLHSFFEAQLPEKFGDSYNFYTGDAVYISDVKKETWRILLESHHLVDSLIIAGKKLQQQVPADQVFQKDEQGNVYKNRYGQTKYSFAYAQKYHELLNGLIERQLKVAIKAVSSFWYTAWVNAGKPDLNGLDASSVTHRNARFLRKDLKSWRKGKLFGLKTVNEF